MDIMQFLKEWLSSIDLKTIAKIILNVGIVIILTWIALKIVKNFLIRFEQKMINKSAKEGEPPTESEKRINTVTRLLNQAIILAVLLISLMVILKQIGIEIGPILAGAGIVGLAVGFGAQNLVRDIIAGFFIILENQIRVGDVAIINGTGGLVEKIKFRTIVLRDLGGIVHVFPNGTITTLSNVTNEWSAYVFDIGVAYKENTDHVIEIMQEVGTNMKKDEKFMQLMLDEPEIFGVDKFDDSAVIIKGRIKTKPIKQWVVGREYLRRIKLAFDENNIEIPFPHRSVYFGENSKPIDIELFEKYKNGVSENGETKTKKSKSVES